MTIVLLHGFTQTGASWGPLSKHLTSSPVISPDLAGHGSAVDVRDDLATAADRILDDHPGSILVGYSMGGRLALHAAVHDPSRLRGLVLIGATPGIADGAEREARRIRDNQLADRVEDIGLEAFLTEWLDQPLFATLPPERRTLDDRRSNTVAGLAWSLRHWSTGVQDSLWDSLALVTCPVLLVTGSLDTKFTEIARSMLASIGSRSRHVIVDGAGHAVHLEQPRIVAELIDDFSTSLPT